MKISKSLVCPKCGGIHFEIKREATYLYTYKLDTPNTESWSSEEEALPFLFDNRDQISNKEYFECLECGARYDCDLEHEKSNIHFTILKKAIRSDLEKNPRFLG